MRPILLALIAALFLPAAALAETLPERSERLAAYLEKSDSWAMRAMVLLALAEVKHPSAVRPFENALEDKDGRIIAYATSALDSVDEEALHSGTSADLIDRLVEKELKRNFERHHTRVLSILSKIAGRGLADRKDAEAWWREARPGYAPAAWDGSDVEIPPERPADSPPGGSQVVRLIEKLFDLSENGLEICFVIDATGSMQPTIDAVRDSIDNLAVLLGSIVPRFRIGVVIYRDLEDMKDGARMMSPLTTDTRSVKEDLARETAMGGGDLPERVEKGLEVALGLESKMGWTPKPGKVVVVIGDAPPHDADLQKCVDLAKDAHENPFGAKGGAVTTGGKRRRLAPFVVSTILVGAAPPSPEHAFTKIAQAGGGASMPLAESAGVTKQILVVSFGQEWEREIGKFVELFERFRDEGIFR